MFSRSLVEHKLTVAETMIHIGSSFTGKNFDNDTVLGRFIEEIKSGKIPSLCAYALKIGTDSGEMLNGKTPNDSWT